MANREQLNSESAAHSLSLRFQYLRHELYACGTEPMWASTRKMRESAPRGRHDRRTWMLFTSRMTIESNVEGP